MDNIRFKTIMISLLLMITLGASARTAKFVIEPEEDTKELSEKDSLTFYACPILRNGLLEYELEGDASLKLDSIRVYLTEHPLEGTYKITPKDTETDETVVFYFRNYEPEDGTISEIKSYFKVFKGDLIKALIALGILVVCIVAIGFALHLWKKNVLCKIIAVVMGIIAGFVGLLAGITILALGIKYILMAIVGVIVVVIALSFVGGVASGVGKSGSGGGGNIFSEPKKQGGWRAGDGMVYNSKDAAEKHSTNPNEVTFIPNNN